MLLLSTTFSFIAMTIVATTFLLVSVFYAHTGSLTRFLHRLGFVYLIYYLWLESSGIVLTNYLSLSEVFLEIAQEDSLFFRLFFIYSTFTLAIFFFGVADRFFLSKRGRIEFPILLLFLHLGGLFALRLHTFRDRLIALERVTLASYVFVTFERQNRFSTYAGVQYFILGSFPSAMLLLAFALFYLQSGSRAFQDMDLFFNTTYELSSCNFITDETTKLSYRNSNMSKNFINVSTQLVIPLLEGNGEFYSAFPMDKIESIASSLNPINSRTVVALGLLFFNFFFKITAAPFHVWAPSVYGKAPTASVAILSIYSKLLIFFIRFKLINSFIHTFSSITSRIFLSLGTLSIFVGRIGAFSEKQIKSFFVYSSMGHVGFRLIGLGLNSLEGASATFTYLAIYILTSFVRWFLLLTRGRQNTHLSHLGSLKSSNPLLAILFAFIVFSRSGIPPLGGFFVKLDILSSLLDSAHFFLTYIIFIFTVISFFYYLRVIKIRFFDMQENVRSAPLLSFSAIDFSEYPRNGGRLWIRSSILIFLAVYLIIVQKPLRAIQYEVLGTLY
jgi:NADH:ubiquinone oxidoreductase subunit 2 (subunit N)